MTLKIRTPLRGYTIVELMMSLAVMTIGVTGVISMKKVTISSNQHAKNLNIATHIAQAWQEQLAADAVLWNRGPSSGSRDIGTDPTWLRFVETNENQWFQPTYDPNRDFGGGFDALGNVVAVNGSQSGSLLRALTTLLALLRRSTRGGQWSP